MKEEKHSIKKWVYWFTLALAIIVLYNILGNFTSIGKWLGNLIGVLRPFFIGILIAYILYLPSKKIEIALKSTKPKRFLNKHARGLSIILTYIIVLLIIIIMINCIFPIIKQSLTDLIANLPGYYNSVIENINSLPEDHILKSDIALEIINNLKNIDLQKFFNFEKIQEYIRGILSAVEVIFDTAISIIVSVYILAQRKQIIEFLSKLTRAIFKPKAYIKIKRYFNEGNEVFFKFLTSQIIDAILVGILVSVAMSIIGVKYSVLLGFMIGLFNLIPYFGAIIAVIIAIIITILTGGIGQAIIMAVVVIILQQIDANIINPRLVRNTLHISQLLVILSITIGGAYFGVPGMFLGVPVITIIKMILDDWIEEKLNKKPKHLSTN